MASSLLGKTIDKRVTLVKVLGEGKNWVCYFFFVFGSFNPSHMKPNQFSSDELQNWLVQEKIPYNRNFFICIFWQRSCEWRIGGGKTTLLFRQWDEERCRTRGKDNGKEALFFVFSLCLQFFFSKAQFLIICSSKFVFLSCWNCYNNKKATLPKHPNLVHFYESITINGVKSTEIFLVMEHCGGGNLLMVMNRRLNERFPEKEIFDIFSNIVEAVGVLQLKCNPPVLHRDLKVRINVWASIYAKFHICLGWERITLKPRLLEISRFWKVFQASIITSNFSQNQISKKKSQKVQPQG